MTQAVHPSTNDSPQHLAELLQRHAFAEAAALAARLCEQAPDNAELARLHSIALLRLGRRADALSALHRAAELAPDHIEVQCNLASTQLEEGDTEAAIERLRAALRRTPGHPAILLGLGNALMTSARYTQAREAYAMATHGAPEHPGLRLNLAAAELELGNLAQAATHVDEALSLAPELDSAHELHGHVLQAQGRTHDAAQAYLRAEQLAPERPQHPLWAGLMLDESGQLALAAEAYARALRRDPTSGPALSQLVFAKRRLCDWHELDALSAQLHRAVIEERPGIMPFPFLAEEASAALQHRCAATFAAGIEAQMAPLRQQLDFSYPAGKADAPWRVGFVSNGFGEHSTGRLVVALFEALQGTGLDLHLFATTTADNGSIYRRLQAVATMHDVVNLGPARTATRIRQTGVEILIDLRGYGSGSHIDLFELRPAPIQVNWLTCPGTSGAPWMDYLLTDAVALPAPLREHFSEKLIRLPRCFIPYDSATDKKTIDEGMLELEPAPTRSDCGLPTHGTVFASFNNSYKINPATFSHFMAILRRVPDSVLWLHAGPDAANQRLRTAAITHGVMPDRLIFLPQLFHAQYLARLAHVDLFLDTLPYNAQASAIDALWSGCPVLTCPGPTLVGRVGASLLHHVGLPELIVEGEQAFIEMAIRLGSDREALNVLRRHLLQQRSRNPLFDMQGFATDFRRAIQAMGARHRIGRPPADLDL
ncbi:tetratricopeptide repeat protein [Dyella tabacisoli]|uniref:protein O-GlcNAc transferase n=1 Tax=Dyella tabacisoli TaxID=2282381 RepID=A0A369UT97_9GAMM|nr:tetratricopeptide repeat protein [Dyella tabacisoli]RDD81569.1 UDP-N-acetylglucosamine-peptide N-acetylglucosaminyltransferase [Dyella tabacisoli]